MQTKATLRDVRKALLSQKMNVSEWAKKNNFDYNATIKILARYSIKPQLPCSARVYEVLTQLKKDTGINLMEAKNVEM